MTAVTAAVIAAAVTGVAASAPGVAAAVTGVAASASAPRIAAASLALAAVAITRFTLTRRHPLDRLFALFPRDPGIDRVAHPLRDPLPTGRHECDHEAGVSCPPGAAGAMGVVLVVVGQVVVKHEADVVHVDAASRDVGRDEGLDLAPLEILERALTNRLAACAVQGSGLDAGAVEILRDIVDAEAGLDEDDRRAVLFDQRNGRVEAVARAGDHELVIYRSSILFVHQVVSDGVVHVVADEFVDISVEGRRPQHGLASCRGHVEDLADVGHEAEVGHPVGFVDDTYFDGTEVAVALLDDVEQTARCCHHDRRALAQ